MYAPRRSSPIPEHVVERLFHAASLLREHRDDGHIAALMAENIGLTDEGRAVEQMFEDRTADLATWPYEALEPDELEELVEWVTPGSARRQPRR